MNVINLLINRESLVEDITAIRTSWQTPIYALNLNNLLATSSSVELETFFKCALRHLTASPRTLITWHSPIDSPLPVSFAPPFSRQSSKLYTFTLVCIGSIRYFINGRNVEGKFTVTEYFLFNLVLESMDYVLQYSTSLAGVKQEPSFTLLALNLFNEDLSACPGPIQIVSRSIFRHFIKELPLISIKALIFKWFQALPSRSTTANDAYKSTKKLHLVFVLAALAVLEIEMSADERNKAILIDIEDLAAAPSHDGNDQQSSHEGHDDGRGRLVRLGRGIKKEIAFSIAVLLQSEQNTLADASMARLAIGFLVEGWDLWEPFLLASTSAQFSSLANKAPGRDLSATSAPATPVHLILIRKLFYLASLSNRSKHSKSSLFTKSSPKHNASPNGKDNEARAAISRFQLIPGRSFAVHEYRNAKTTSKSLGAVLAQAARNCLTRLAEKPVYLNTVCGELLISGLKDGNWERLWVTLKSGVGAIVKNVSCAYIIDVY